MPLHIVRVNELTGAYQPIRGAVSGSELLAENMDMFFGQTEKFSQCRFWYADFAGSDLTAVEAGDIQALKDIAAEACKVNADLVVAIYAPEDLPFGLGRMWSMLAKETGWRLATFRTEEEAFNWMGGLLGCELRVGPEHIVPGTAG